MARKLKTITVDALRDYVNDMLRRSTTTPDTRQGMIDVLESMLHLTNNYAGYTYLQQHEVPNGELPGIRPQPSTDRLVKIDPFINTDKTRVRYF
jgi:hypothetical protein